MKTKKEIEKLMAAFEREKLECQSRLKSENINEVVNTSIAISRIEAMHSTLEWVLNGDSVGA